MFQAVNPRRKVIDMLWDPKEGEPKFAYPRNGAKSSAVKVQVGLFKRDDISVKEEISLRETAGAKVWS